MKKTIEINVFKSTNNNQISFIVEKDGKALYWNNSISVVGETIKNSPTLNKEDTELRIDCSPDYEITRKYGKNPSHNEALSEEEEKQLFEKLHY
ncbi:MAG: hypothetical protein KBB91_01150 [Candidatus Pacebacteria bacterium]|jgi:hypothetical protein|nr:hypothetical protein [Candidatus Paceibacterota bacterium]MBP9700962.1 hypothetical protein [Candidatus Paceibacterota bacterium]